MQEVTHVPLNNKSIEKTHGNAQKSNFGRPNNLAGFDINLTFLFYNNQTVLIYVLCIHPDYFYCLNGKKNLLHAVTVSFQIKT